MKAACLLVCLALVHGISGSIFEPQVDKLIVEPSDYISQYQQQESHQNQQQTEDQKNHQSQEKYNQEQQSEETQYYKKLQEQLAEQLKYQLRRQQRQSEELHSEERKNQHQSEEWKNQRNVHSINLHYRPHSQYSMYPQTEEHNKENEHKGSKRWQKENAHQHGSSSSESRESKERNHRNIKKLIKKWNHDDTTVVTVEQMGPIVMWSEQQIPVQQNAVTANDIKEIFTEAQKAMNHIKQEDKAQFLKDLEVAIQKQEEDVTYNATQLAQKHNYPIEEHTLKTDDGYLLTLFRIPPKVQTRDVQKRPVAFLMHDLLGSADDWLLMGPGKSLAFMLADEGYDVWLGNARGNKYSRRHVSKHPAVSDFWQFSIDEIAQQDLPSMIDYTLKTTNQEKLHYIGHSLGTTAFFALTASQPEYNAKISMMHALSPVAYMTNVRSPLLRMIAPTSKFHQNLQAQLGNGAFTPKKELLRVLGGEWCETEIGSKNVCSNVNFVMAGVNMEGMAADVIPVIMSHLPAGTSTKMIKHFAQGVASQEFKKYDYGSQTNQEVYGQPEPPKYDLQKVSAPVSLHYSEEDWLAHPTDVTRLQNQLSNVYESNIVPEKHFSHMDFQFSKNAPELVYKRLIESMQKQESS